MHRAITAAGSCQKCPALHSAARAVRPSAFPCRLPTHPSLASILPLLSPVLAACSALLPWHPGGWEVGLEGEGMTSGGRGSGLRIGVGFHWDLCLSACLYACIWCRGQSMPSEPLPMHSSVSLHPFDSPPAGMSGPICGSPVLLAGLDPRRPTAPSSRSSTRRSLAGAVEARYYAKID